MSKNIHLNPLWDLHSRYGCANFGFKVISNPNCKYGDRHLYRSNAVYQSEPKISQKDNYILTTQSFSVQKAGHAIAECEDVWHGLGCYSQTLIALSDGATESSFAKEWAKQLVTNFVNRDLLNRDDLKTVWLKPLQLAWQEWLASQDLSWFAKRKAEGGSFATFLGLAIFHDLSWKCLAVGDSCLFIVRNYRSQNYRSQNYQLHKSFPLQKSNDFNNRPRLIGTHVATGNIHISQTHGIAEIGDRFYLATDAIACWIFKQMEANQNPWVKLDKISSQDMFANWINELRDRHEIANDDTTLLCLKVRCQP